MLTNVIHQTRPLLAAGCRQQTLLNSGTVSTSVRSGTCDTVCEARVIPQRRRHNSSSHSQQSDHFPSAVTNPQHLLNERSQSSNLSPPLQVPPEGMTQCGGVYDNVVSLGSSMPSDAAQTHSQSDLGGSSATPASSSSDPSYFAYGSISSFERSVARADTAACVAPAPAGRKPVQDMLRPALEDPSVSCSFAKFLKSVTVAPPAQACLVCCNRWSTKPLKANQLCVYCNDDKSTIKRFSKHNNMLPLLKPVWSGVDLHSVFAACSNLSNLGGCNNKHRCSYFCANFYSSAQGAASA